MDPREQIRQLMSRGGEGMYPILFDLLEEHAWDAELLELAASLAPWTVPEGQTVPTDAAHDLARLLGELAKVDYPRAAEVLVQVDAALPRNDYRTHGLLVDAINTAWFNRPTAPYRRADMQTPWQDQLRYEQMEQVTGETNGDLGLWAPVDDQGIVRQRWWTTDFAPEWMEHELDREFPDSTFKTVYDDLIGREELTYRDPQGLWRQVRTFSAGGEPECPYVGAVEGDLVTLEQTYYGDHPGKSCALCEGDLGEEHGVIYLGEFGANVYRLDVANGVTRIEIVQLGSDERWSVVLFVGEDEVEVHDLNTDYYDTLEEAQQAVRDARGTGAGDILPGIPVDVIQL